MCISKFLLENHFFCTGCAACFNSCPYNAITMKEDKEGFLYPFVDEHLCRNCRICVTKCPVLSPRLLPDTQNVKPLGYAYISEGKVRNNSSSGGFFHILSEYVLRHGGVVFGAAFNKNWDVEHQVVKTIEDIDKLQTSKYSAHHGKLGDTKSKTEFKN